jgi:acetyl esterase/lipase
LFIAVACKKENSEGPKEDLNAEKTQLDVSYGTDDKQKMDVYLPAGRDTVNTKLMVLIHGGAWMQGDKADFTANINDIKKLLPGYAFANINYRLYNNLTGANKFPSQEEDVKAALSYLLGKKAEYHFSNKVVLLGASAGAHLALLQGYKNAGSITPKAIISYFGPTDLAYLYNNPGLAYVPGVLAGIVGSTPALNAAAYASSSPINYVTPKSAPTLLLQGDKDLLVPVAQANLLGEKLKAAGVTYELVVYPNEEHGFTPATMNASILKVISFLQTNVP